MTRTRKTVAIILGTIVVLIVLFFYCGGDL